MFIKYTRRVLALILSGAIALSLTACTNSNSTMSDPISDNSGMAPLVSQHTPESIPSPSEATVTENDVEQYHSPVQTGEIIRFGDYDWRVLDVQGSKALIITDKIIENRVYNSATGTETTWAECNLRQYLNSEFYNTFSENDKQGIAQTTNQNPDNPWHGTDGGDDTTDYIFLLSLDEVVRYFGDSGQLSSRPSDISYIDDDFNGARAALHMGGTFTDSISGYTHTVNADGTWGWWLRSPGAYNQYVTTIAVDGYVMMYGINTHLVDIGVRPALWLDLGAVELSGSTPSQEPVIADDVTFRDENGNVILNSTHIKSVEAVKSDGENYAVLFIFTDEGSDILASATLQIIGQTMSLYINDNPAYSAQIMEAIVNGEMMLGGTFTKENADFMAKDITARLNQ